MDELREAAESMKRSYSVHDPEKESDEAHTIHNPVVKEAEAQREGVTLLPLKTVPVRRSKNRNPRVLKRQSQRKTLPLR